MLMILLIIVVLVLMVGGAPNFGPFYHSYGYAPVSLGAVLLVVLVVLLVSGRL
jgi:hypothetical protein